MSDNMMTYEESLRAVLANYYRDCIFSATKDEASNNPIPVAPTEKESRRRYKMKNPQTLFKDVEFFDPLT